MGRLLPFKSEPTRTPDEPRVLDLDDEATEEALAALSSDTARQILGTLYEEPKTPPEIRDEVGTSLQNVHYHVERLEDAELIKSAGEGYSEKGTEMTIYAPASEALVLFAGREHDRSRLKTALTRLLGSVGLLAVASLAVRRLFGESGARLGEYGVSFGMGSSGDSGEAQPGGDAGDAGGDGGAGGGDGAGSGDGAADESGGTDGGDGDSVDDSGDGADAGDGEEELTETPTAEDDVGIFGGEQSGTGDAGGASPTPESTPTPTQEPTAASTPSPAGTPSPTPAETPTATAQPTATPQATPTETAPPTAMPEAMDTLTPTASPSPTPEPAGVESGTASPATDPNLSAQTVDGARQVADSGGDGLLADPAVAFFFGGLFMIVVVTVWWYYQG